MSERHYLTEVFFIKNGTQNITSIVMNNKEWHSNLYISSSDSLFLCKLGLHPSHKKINFQIDVNMVIFSVKWRHA